MTAITVVIPSVGSEVYLGFKEPFSYQFRNKFNTNELGVKFKIVSVIDMRDSIKNDQRDPFSSIYVPVNLSEVEYKEDLLDGIPIISVSFVNKKGVEQFFRLPGNYIASVSSPSAVEYINRLTIVDLGKLPIGLDVGAFQEDLKDFIEERFGVRPSVSEVSVGAVELVDQSEHETRETVRTNSVTVFKNNATELQELRLAYDSIVDRLDDLNISLS